ncbi:hypothetical protein D9M71_717600 [compost metagenome]
MLEGNCRVPGMSLGEVRRPWSLGTSTRPGSRGFKGCGVAARLMGAKAALTRAALRAMTRGRSFDSGLEVFMAYLPPLEDESITLGMTLRFHSGNG